MLLDALVKVCKMFLSRYKDDPTARMICYVRNKQIGLLLVEELNYNIYYATLTEEERKRNITTWRQGLRLNIIIATATLGAGIDYPSVRNIVHIDAPSGIVDYIQETGRAGRDGLYIECITVLLDQWNVS